MGGGAFWNVYRYGVVHQRLQLPGLTAPLKLAQLSDLHYGPFIDTGSVREWVASTMQLQPDLIVLTGDFLDSRNSRPVEPFFEALAPLQAPLGVWACWGNHDHINRRRLVLLESELTGLGIFTLNNGVASPRADLQLAAIDDWRLGSPDLPGTMAQLTPGTARILLSHNPDALPLVRAGSVDLALCGHTHGGQVNLPLVGAPITGSEYGQRFASGWVDAPVAAYVNRGLGVSGLPFRVFCPPEITLFELSPVA